MSQTIVTKADIAAIRFKGILIALVILVSWAALLGFLLQSRVEAMPVLAVIGGILLQTFLYTGLFITAHDAMHGVIAPRWPRVNALAGSIALVLYALFSFTKLKEKHWQHHDEPASPDDPDFHAEGRPRFWQWYFHFMWTYVSIPQLAGMAVLFHLLHFGVGVEIANLLLFWTAPALLSTLQLFYFGTYLPHREPASGHAEPHRAVSNAYPVPISFLTCYHFGYHWEHHAYPYVPWWRLPAVRKAVQAGNGKDSQEWNERNT